MSDVTGNEKLPDNDFGVVNEDDVWIGTREIVLGGVKIGRGIIEGARAVVTKLIPPYADAVSNPAQVVRLRWPKDDIFAHEKKLNPEEARLHWN
jgi:maltose O-acetyltransferase